MLFKVGDRVISQKWGEGTVVCSHKSGIYTIEVQWDNSEEPDYYTPEGLFSCRTRYSTLDIRRLPSKEEQDVLDTLKEM